jgi:hypothetical protein
MSFDEFVCADGGENLIEALKINGSGSGNSGSVCRSPDPVSEVVLCDWGNA